jgi:hypothetical protein
VIGRRLPSSVKVAMSAPRTVALWPVIVTLVGSSVRLSLT